MNKKTKLIGLGVGTLLVIGILSAAAMKKGTKAVDVKIEPVERRDLTASVTASGQVRPQTKVDVASDISGKIIRLSVKEGQVVAKGDFLLEIDPQQAQAAVDRSQAALESAKANQVQAVAAAAQAKKSYERSADIKKNNSSLVSDEQLDQLRTASDVNKAMADASLHAVGQAQASVRDAQQALGKTLVYAPMSGRVTRLNVEQGETAVPGTFNKDAATLLTISDMSVLETRAKAA